MLISTKGIVLKSVKFQETSLIVKIFTQSHGLLSFLVNGVRASKSKNKASLFQPLTFLDLVVYYRDNKNLLRLKEYRNAFIYQSLPFDIVKSTAAQLLLEVINQCIVEEEENEQLFNFLSQSFQDLDTSQEVDAKYILVFLINLMKIIGIQPHGNYASQTPFFNLKEGAFSNFDNHQDLVVSQENTHYLSNLFKGDTASIPKKNRKELLDILLQYYKIHVDGFKDLKSLKVIASIWD